MSLYDEHGSRLYVIKIVTGRDGQVKEIVKRVFDKKTDPVEEYEVIGIVGRSQFGKKA